MDEANKNNHKRRREAESMREIGKDNNNNNRHAAQWANRFLPSSAIQVFPCLGGLFLFLCAASPIPACSAPSGPEPQPACQPRLAETQAHALAHQQVP